MHLLLTIKSQQLGNTTTTTTTTNNSNSNSNSWAYGPDGWRTSPWRYGSGPGRGGGGYPVVEPGGTIEEIEEGRAAAAAPAALTAVPMAPGMLSSEQDVQHNHYYHHPRPGDHHRCHSHNHSHSRRNCPFDTLYEAVRDDRDNRELRDGFLRLMDRERDRDRGGANLAGPLDRELNRRRGLRSGRDADGRDGGNEAEGEGEESGGLRKEIEALKKDLGRLTTGREGKASLRRSKGNRAGFSAGAGKGRGDSGGRIAASPSTRGQTSPAVGHNNIVFGRRTDTGDQVSEEGEDEEAGEGSDDDDSFLSDRMRASGQDVGTRGRSSRRAGIPFDSPDQFGRVRI